MFEAIAAKFEGLSVGSVIRWVGTVLTVVLPLWAWGGSYIQAVAGQAFAQAMKDHGVDPQAFKTMQEQMAEATEADKKRDLDSTVIQGDIASIKNQNRQIIDLLTKLRQ